MIQPGGLFFALLGEKVDGLSFLPEVAARGAIAAIVPNHYTGDHYGLTLLHVPNPLAALHKIAQWIVSEYCQGKIIAITGSVGKTTTKDFTASLVSQQFNTFKTQASQNSQTNLPIQLLNHLDTKHEVIVLEMGMSLPGELEKLVSIAPPDIALITTVSHSHYANFNDLRKIALEKGKIFSDPKTSLGLLPTDLPYQDEIVKIGSCEKIFTSAHSPQATYYLEKVDGSLIMHHNGEKIALGSWAIPGFHQLQNLAGAIAAARSVGVSWDNIRIALPSLTLPERRFQQIVKNGILFINDTYNAGPTSMKAALDTLQELPGNGKKYAVFGEMRELGEIASTMHYEVGKYAINKVDQLFCLGNETLQMAKAWHDHGHTPSHHESLDALINALKTNLKNGDIVLLKASNGVQLWKLLDKFNE